MRAARERRGASREALAVDSGVSWSAIAQIESGRRANLRPGTLSALASALGVTIDYLVTGDGVRRSMLEHSVLIYDDDRSFKDLALSFVLAARERSEPVLVVTARRKLSWLRRRLAADGAGVEFVDREVHYRSPAGALARDRAFVERAVQSGAAWAHVLGESPSNAETDAEIRCWARYDALINVVLGAAPLTVVCLYDTREHEPTVVEHARTTHPEIVVEGSRTPNPDYADPAPFVLGD